LGIFSHSICPFVNKDYDPTIPKDLKHFLFFPEFLKLLIPI